MNMKSPEKKDYLIILSIVLFIFLIIPVTVLKSIFFQYFGFLDKWVDKPIQMVRRSIVSKVPEVKTSDKGDMSIPELSVVNLSIRINAEKVLIIGDFTKWKAKEMLKNSSDKWSFSMPVIKGVYRYIFIVDGKEMLDPSNPDFDFYENKKVSVLRVE